MTIKFFHFLALLVAANLLSLVPVFAQNKSNEPIPPMPKLLSQREQTDVRETWLEKRLGSLLLPMMKKHGVEMWIVVNEEFHSDPVTQHIVPPIPIVGRRDLFMFIDRGDRIERIAIVRYLEERLKNHYTVMNPPRTEMAAALKKLVDERNPKTLALNIGGTRGQQSGLTYDGYKFLAEALGPDNEKKFVSAANLLTDLPSVDREEDGGKLLAHKAWWKYPGAEIRHSATITELIFARDSIADGLFLLNLQIASFEIDASPSKPVLYALID